VIGQEWHIDGDDLADYAEGRTGPVMLASVEAHLIACERCRSALSMRVHADDARDDTRADRVWAGCRRVDRGNRLFSWSSRLLWCRSPARRWLVLLLAGAGRIVSVARLSESGTPRRCS
jgi:hypothetical protein